MSTTTQFRIGQSVIAHIGGQHLPMTVGDILHTPTQGTLVRSTSEQDHVWTHLWIAAGAIEVV